MWLIVLIVLALYLIFGMWVAYRSMLHETVVHPVPEVLWFYFFTRTWLWPLFLPSALESVYWRRRARKELRRTANKE